VQFKSSRDRAVNLFVTAAASKEPEPGPSASGFTEKRVEAASPVALMALERRLLEAVRRRGISRLVSLVTFYIVAFSTVVTLLALRLTIEDFEVALLPGRALGALVPLLFAPPPLLLRVRLTAPLDDAGHRPLRAAATRLLYKSPGPRIRPSPRPPCPP